MEQWRKIYIPQEEDAMQMPTKKPSNGRAEDASIWNCRRNCDCHCAACHHRYGGCRHHRWKPLGIMRWCVGADLPTRTMAQRLRSTLVLHHRKNKTNHERN
jgi:hypothetical protein